jgi:hypothetical protein
MNQKEFTEYIIPKIIDRFPQFKGLCTTKPNDIIDIDYKSPQGKLILRLTTQAKEVTIGFDSGTKLDWHVHMNQFGANTPDEELEEAIKRIDNIITDKEIIVYSSVLGYFITDDIEGINKYKEKDEIIETFYWSDL